MADLTFKQELNRKLIHLSSVIYPLLYLFVSQKFMIITLFVLFILCLIWDLLRIKQINPFGFLNIFLREKEIKQKKLTGATWFLLSCALVTLIFSQHVAILSMLILIFCDTIASLVGKKFGKTKIPHLEKKSLEGFIAFIGLAIIISYAYIYYFELNNNVYILIAIIVSALVELYSTKIHVDDNLGVTLAFAIICNLGF